VDAPVVLVPQDAVDKRAVGFVELPQLNQLLAYLRRVVV